MRDFLLKVSNRKGFYREKKKWLYIYILSTQGSGFNGWLSADKKLFQALLQLL